MMPIEKELNFQNEADFTSRFLAPLLRRLGYSIVAEYHGPGEFGKDLVFGEIDRFGEVAYHGLQAKYVGSIGQRESEGLIDDCRQAFRNPFRHPNTGAEHRISTFVVANAGSIADNARENFFAAATGSEHGGNIRLFDGKALLGIDRWATINRSERVGEMLSGLLLELRCNRPLMQHISDRLKAFVADQLPPYPIERLRLGATSHYLQAPTLDAHINADLAGGYLTAVEGINGILDYLSGTGPLEHKLQLATDVQEVLAKCAEYGDLLQGAIDATLSKLGPLAAM
jgi:hypothetical protein